MNIPVYQPYFSGKEKAYVNECLDSSWISSKGDYINKFEYEFAEFIGSKFATSVCNGTVALQLALLALEIKPGDEIIVPTLTYVASVNSIVQMGAIPVFVDSLTSTWQIDPEDVRRKITNKTRAIMAVHLYGHPCDMDALINICQQHHLLLIEDCAEAFGTYYRNQHVGTFGEIATFSFYGNKTITTGEGGMVVMNDAQIHARASAIKNQGVSKEIEYWHDIHGYNYRMTNICAAIGLAQLENAPQILTRKREIAAIYSQKLKGLPLVTHEPVGDVQHSYWMCSILLNEAVHRDPLRDHLRQAGIETRPLFYPSHFLPMYKSNFGHHPVAESLSVRGINLPSWPGLTSKQLDTISDKIKEYFS